MLPAPPVPLRMLVASGLRLAVRALLAARPDLPAADVLVAPSQVVLSRLRAGERVDLLLTADIGLAAQVALTGWPAMALGSDTAMAAARPEIGLTSDNFLQRLLDERIRVIIAQPGLHATGDLAAALFDRADRILPGAYEVLLTKSRQTLIPASGLSSPLGPRRVMEALSAGEADIVLATASLVRALSAVADLVQPPRELQGQLVPGLAILSQTPARRRLARAVADALLDREGQALLARHGFGPPPIL